ncbi:MAG TPA: SMP-30/gluconolactonase/LRE family protein [Streptosporangiaceae bacterium]|nr:SMP-30/gluconolactonase/LRE family protein [Streptosporangiaceae bacterium]
MKQPADDLIILEPTEMLLPSAQLGEGPHWDIPTQTLYWVDIPAQHVHSMDATGSHKSWDVGMPIGAVVPRASGGLIFAGGSGGRPSGPALRAATVFTHLIPRPDR